MYRTAITVAVCALLTASVRPASAQGIQQWIDRGYVNINVAFDSGSGSLDDSVTFRQYDDNGTKSVAATQDSGALFDFAVGGRVWRNVAAGIGFHRGSTDGEGIATISVPSPVSFSLPARTASVPLTELERTERAIHLQIGYMFPINDKLDVLVLGGPSFFHLNQDVVSDVNFSEVGPPFTAINAVPVVTERSDSVTGVNIGADVTYKLRDTTGVAVGVGGFLRYSGAGADVLVMQNEADSDVGGVQIGFGVRFRF
jgi:hypothetical protein